MANIKELSKIPERLTSGHRLCSGCGASITVRQVLMGTKSPVVVGAATGCLEVASTIYPFTAWNTPFIHNAFENVAATISGAETAYRALKKKGKIKRDIKFVAFGGDGGTYDIGLQSLSGALERGHNFVYVCYDNEGYMNCLSLDSMIMTKTGLRKITDIKIGDEVYAFDQKKHKPVLKNCTGVFDNGMKEVFKVNTLHQSIKATGNHPFLVLKRNGRGKKNHFTWKTVDKLKAGDEVVTLKKLNIDQKHNFMFTMVSLEDYKVNNLNEVNLPSSTSPDLMKYLGIYVGDGWVRNNRGEIGFALPKNTKARKIFKTLHKNLFGSKIRTDDMYIYANSVNLANFINSMEIGSGAKNKTVPGWVFTLPKKQKENFVEGLMLSDGYKIGKSCRYVSASQSLLKNLRLLLQTMDYRVGKIHTQVKKKGTKCVNRKLLKDSEYGYICFSKKRKWNVKKYPNQYKYQDFLINNENFKTEKITSIKSVGNEPTLDLRVEGEHNFIADGFVVHNTGIQRSSATPTGASTTTAPAGKESYGKPQVRKDLTAIVAAHKIPYVAQACSANWNDLVTKSQKAFEVEGPAFLNVLSLCHRGWRYKPEDTVSLSKLAVETGFWPLLECENGKWKINYRPKQRKPIEEFLKPQGRFKHLFKEENKHVIEKIQKDIDSHWEYLEKLEKATS